MLKRIRNAMRASGGMAAVEFAMLAPVLLTMFLGGIELTDALDCKQKVTGMASTAADLIAQETQVSTGDMSDVFSAVNSTLYPYPTTNLQVVVSSIIPNGSGGAKVAWSCGHNATKRATNSTVVVPTGIIATGGSVILAEVSYPYQSAITSLLAGSRFTFLNNTTTMTTSFYSRPRRSTTITGPGTCPPISP